MSTLAKNDYGFQELTEKELMEVNGGDCPVMVVVGAVAKYFGWNNHISAVHNLHSLWR